MRITNLEIEGYGVWSGLRIEKLGDGLNVLYGPNEAGKTTLLQFIRSMLYGFSPKRRQYLPPVHGGRHGGVLDVEGPNGRFAIGRFSHTLPDGSSDEEVTLTAADGTRQGEHFIKVLLSNVDEPVFNNVFAVGLREIQELATLSDTEAAELLYSLSAGLDRVSLVEVLRELEASRNRILDVAGKPCQVLQLLAEREKLRVEIEELGSINRRYGHLVGERDQFQQDITRLEEERNRAEHLIRVMDLAIALRDRWAQRAAIDDQLATPGTLKDMPEGGLDRLDAINAKIREREERIAHLAQVRETAKREFAALAVNDALWRQAARISAFKEQEPWITQLQGQIGEIQGEIAAMESELAAEGERLGLKSSSAALPVFAVKTLSALRAPANAMRSHRQRLEEARQAASTAQQTAESLAGQIESALTLRGQPDLATAMDRAGGLVSQLRRRVQIDERLDQLARYQVELEERSRHLVDRQMLPIGVIVGLGIVFVVGVVLVLVGLFMPASITGSIGWALALLGGAGCAAAVVGKVMLERSNVHQFDACQKQLGVLQLQVQQAKDDREALDAQLPRGGGSISSRLQTAEGELATLEELAPLDTRRSTARQDAEAAARRVDDAEKELAAARQRWHQGLNAVGLPIGLGPKQVRLLAQHGDRIAETQRRLAQRREDVVRRQRELDALTGRIVQLAADAGVSLASSDPILQLRQLSEAASHQEAGATRRDALRSQARRIRVARSKCEVAIGSLKHKRRLLFLEAGVGDEQEFRQRALQCARAEVLRRDRDAIAREIETALASQCGEDAIRKQLEGEQAASLVARRDDLGQRLSLMQQQLRELLERRGRLSQQLESLAADRQLADKQLDLAVLDKRLEDAIHRWQVLAATCGILDRIRTIYEQQRQPETLQEASGYLDRLTQGRYHRVWTPLGEHALRVDDSEGRSLPVEVLSRGTREQLFLALRLALTSSYARRGAPLPLILDDVLVNFDADRAKAAAAVLRDYAAAGHQLVIFTCHEHILRLFKSLKAPVSRLPNNSEPGPLVISLERRSEEKSKRLHEAPPLRHKVAAKAPKPEPDTVTELADDLADDEAEDFDEDEVGEDESLWEGDEPYDEFDGDGSAAA